jgi:hypothetical protein
LGIFFIFMGVAALSAVAAEPPDLLLAERYRAGVDVSAYWVSEKLDGGVPPWLTLVDQFRVADESALRARLAETVRGCETNSEAENDGGHRSAHR